MVQGQRLIQYGVFARLTKACVPISYDDKTLVACIDNEFQNLGFDPKILGCRECWFTLMRSYSHLSGSELELCITDPTSIRCITSMSTYLQTFSQCSSVDLITAMRSSVNSTNTIASGAAQIKPQLLLLTLILLIH